MSLAGEMILFAKWPIYRTVFVCPCRCESECVVHFNDVNADKIIWTCLLVRQITASSVQMRSTQTHFGWTFGTDVCVAHSTQRNAHTANMYVFHLIDFHFEWPPAYCSVHLHKMINYYFHNYYRSTIDDRNRFTDIVIIHTRREMRRERTSYVHTHMAHFLL